MVLSDKLASSWRNVSSPDHNVDLAVLGRAQVLCQVTLPAHAEKRAGLGRPSGYLAWEGHDDQSRV